MSTLRTSSCLSVTAAVALLPLLGATTARAADFSTGPVEVAPTGTTATVVSAVDVGHHPGFDRVVFTFAGPPPGYSVAYVPQVTHDASGAALALPGSSFALVTLRPTSTATHAPQRAVTPRFPMLRQIVGAGDVEAVTSYGVGLAGRSGMRVFTLTGPDRLVVDFAIPAGTDTATADDAPATTGPSEVGAAPSGKAGGTASSTDATGASGRTGPPVGVLVGGGALVLLVGLAAGRHLLLDRRAGSGQR